MKYFVTIIFAVFILLSCNDSSNITNPTINTTSQTLSKDGLSQYELIPLPQKSPAWEDSILTVSKVINGNSGGVIHMFKYYITESGSPLFIYANLTIPKNAFTGTKTITMTVDNDFASIHFYPEMCFNKPLFLNQYFQSIDLIQSIGSNFDKIDFIYINDNGNVELIQKNGVQIDNQLGLIKVTQARLQHFSRYGWVRKS